MSKIAVVQQASVLLDKQETIASAVTICNQAADQGAELIIFTEAFISGYPAWIWRLRPGGDWGTSEEIHTKLLHNAVDISGDDLAPLYAVAKQRNITIVCGMNECDHQFSRATLYNTVIVIGTNGQRLNHHRKLMPTNPERMVWGFGDASGLKAVDTPAGRVGTLICWENYMPLARYALYAQGVQLYIAPTYDSGDGWISTLQHIAREGRCWVIGCGNLIHGSHIPDDFPEREQLYPNRDEWINPGDSVVIAPGGKIIAGPMHEEAGILYADVDPNAATEAKRALDVAGHYARPDIFSLHINTQKQTPVKFN